MNTYWNRFHLIIFFACSTLFCLAMLTSFSTVFHKGHPNVESLEISKIRSFRTHAGVDRALINFNLTANLIPAFNWNIKQLFVFVSAKYSTPTNPRNEIILWDKIIESTEDADLHFTNAFIEYGLLDYGAELRDREITLYLHWDRMPLTGKIYMEDVAMSKFTLPKDYGTKKPNKE